MSQQIRRILVALGLMAVLFLTVPSSSRAADLRSPRLAGDLTARLWVWLEGLLPGAAMPAPPHRPVKTSYPSSAVPPPAATADQGNMIDPNGFK